MANQKLNLPKYWNERKKFWYRKSAQLPTQKLIDELDNCIEMLQGKKPIHPPYDRKELVAKATALLYLIKKEREIDLDLARAQYEWLLKEVEKEIKRG